jgi:uncharacterized protein YlxP (DUF503 family)
VTIGVLHLSFLVHGARSLKDKRRVISSLKTQMRNRFNCAVAETDHQDLWQRAQLTACVVSSESRHANEQLDEIARFAGMNRDAELVHYEIELL